MKPQPFVIFLAADERWSLGVSTPGGMSIQDVLVNDASPPPPPELTPEPVELPGANAASVPHHVVLAKKTAKLLTEQGYQDEGVILAIPSVWCLWASLPLAGLRKQKRRQALLFRFEERLPLAAEEMVGDFLEARDTALAVGVQPPRLQPIIAALEDQNVAVDMIVPTTLLAAQGQLLSHPDLAVDALLVQSAAGLELLAMANQRPTAWYTFPPRPHLSEENVHTHLKVLALERARPLRLATLGLTTPFAAGAGDEAVQVAAQFPTNTSHAALAAAPALLAGDTDPWINLRKSALAAPDPIRKVRRSLLAAAGTLLVFLLLFPGVLFWRSTQYQSLQRDYEARQRQTFLQLFPGQTVPLNIHGRLVSEERRLRAVAGDAKELSRNTSALTTLYECLRRLPTDIRYRLMEMRIDGEKVYLEGQVRSHGDANTLAAALRKNAVTPGLTVEAPRTEQLADGAVAFTLLATTPGIPGNVPGSVSGSSLSGGPGTSGTSGGVSVVHVAKEVRK